MIVELHGLEVFGRHGAYEEEQRDGQVFLFDVELDEGAVDYTEVAAAIREISDAQRFDLIEALATAIVDGLHERFRPERVRVRVRKQPAGLPVEYSAVTAERP
jgi:dihydroneopterin aldolase